LRKLEQGRSTTDGREGEGKRERGRDIGREEGTWLLTWPLAMTIFFRRR
jgi:hypothetical protein